MDSLSEKQKEYIKRVKSARIHADKKQEEVALWIGVARNTYTNYESYRSMPQKYIDAFCKFTKVEEKWLISGNGAMHENTEYDEAFSKIEKIWDDFHESSQEELVNFANDLLRIQKAKDRVRE